MMKSFSAFGALIVASALVVPTVSQAATNQSVRVSYADLNLANSAGRTALWNRISNAARSVCEIEDSRDLDLASETKSCRTGAIAAVQPEIDAAIAAVRKGTVTVLDSAALIVSAQ